MKSVSRFARNTVDCLDYVRLLKPKGIGIFFEEQNIDTLKTDSELYLIIYAGFAQSESESIEVHEEEFMALSQNIESLKARINTLREKAVCSAASQAQLDRIQSALGNHQNALKYDDSIVRQMVECIKVYSDGKLEIIFGGGYVVEEMIQ